MLVLDNWSPESVRIPFPEQLDGEQGVRSYRFAGSSYVLVLDANLNESEKALYINVGFGRHAFAAVASYRIFGSP